MIVLAALGLAACESEVMSDYSFGGDYNIVNASSHTVAISRIDIEAPERGGKLLECTLKSEEEYRSVREFTYPLVPDMVSNFTGAKCLLTFDSGISITHDRMDENLEHNICKHTSYDITEYDMKAERYTTTYIYTVTDADYERAVAANGR